MAVLGFSGGDRHAIFLKTRIIYIKEIDLWDVVHVLVAAAAPKLPLPMAPR
jgi:hypothetical protein